MRVLSNEFLCLGSKTQVGQSDGGTGLEEEFDSGEVDYRTRRR